MTTTRAADMTRTATVFRHGSFWYTTIPPARTGPSGPGGSPTASTIRIDPEWVRTINRILRMEISDRIEWVEPDLQLVSAGQDPGAVDPLAGIDANVDADTVADAATTTRSTGRRSNELNSHPRVSNKSGYCSEYRGILNFYS
ncbi:hypothetical protein SAMN05192561_101983 [Halopenitus malekzadehii]|uniref:Uncharacterized protein n=2 Tax=Halopenitus malekzadehii TaxID=1267564 RepID=A0A1H6I2P2_9EURY|nr:hypothetical protein SAMN05192561_101983 [Halopenitus malekzadehii]